MLICTFIESTIIKKKNLIKTDQILIYRIFFKRYNFYGVYQPQTFGLQSFGSIQTFKIILLILIHLLLQH